MNTAVDLGEDRELGLRRVILLYTAENGLGNVSMAAGSAYALTAPAAVEASTGAIAIGAYEPVTMEFVQALARGLGVDLPREVLPASVLCRTQDVIVWWTSPGIRTLFFGDGHKQLARFSGEDFPVPGLIWRLELKDCRIFLRAVAGKRRPSAGTKLYVAPFLNVYNDDHFGYGLVCQGTMQRPKMASAQTLDEWERGFFGASGASQLTKNATSHPGQLGGLWRSLKGKKAFPAHHLVDAGQTLTQFVGGK